MNNADGLIEGDEKIVADRLMDIPLQSMS